MLDVHVHYCVNMTGQMPLDVGDAPIKTPATSHRLRIKFHKMYLARGRKAKAISLPTHDSILQQPFFSQA